MTKDTIKPVTAEHIALRAPRRTDARAIWRLIQNCPPLDVNSSYAYLLCCEHFSETCVVAEQEGSVVGFVSGYQPPGRQDTLFVWQVAVDECARGLGLGRGMLLDLLCRESCRKVKRLETTVSPENEPSRRMFMGLAKALRTKFSEESYFGEELMGETDHEAENLVTVGPFKDVAPS